MDIIRGRQHSAVKTVIYGPEGIGKSTLASHFPEPLFIDTEGSTSYMDVARLKKPTSWTMLKEEVEDVKIDPSCCKTLVLDTADWAEALCIKHVCEKKQVDGIESIGYGKGYVYVKEEFGKLLNLLSDIAELGINVVVTAHAQMRKFEQPDELGAYDRWELKLSKQCAPLLKEWSDLLLFCNYKTMVVNQNGNPNSQWKHYKAQGGKRIMYTSHHPCWDAKNRFGLPPELDLKYEEIMPVIERDRMMKQLMDQQKKDNAAHEAEPKKAPDPVKMEPNQQMDMNDYQAVKEGAPVETKKEEPKKAEGPKQTESIPGINMPVEVEKKEEVPDFLNIPKPTHDKYVSDPEKIPKELRDLMQKDGITEWGLQQAAFAKGYYPENTLVQDMDPEFIKGWFVAFWPQVKDLIKKLEEKEAQVPFE